MSNNNTSSGIGVAGLLGVAFVILKLTGYIDWSWWLVTLPFWILLPVVVLLMLVAVVISFITNGWRR